MVKELERSELKVPLSRYRITLPQSKVEQPKRPCKGYSPIKNGVILG